MYQELTQFKKWLGCQYPNSSASVHYGSDLALFFSYIKKPPSKIISQDVDRYISHSQRQRHRSSTINRRLSAVRTFYYFLSIICDSPVPCPVLPRHRLRKSYPLPRAVIDADIQTLFAYIDSPRDKAMFLLMFDCGLRVGEVHHLSLDDIFFEDPPHLLVHGKGGKQRIVYLSPPAHEILQGWLVSRPVSNDRAVFISEHSQRLSVAGIQYLLRGYCEKAGVKLTAHQLRHTFGSRMSEAHLPLTSLQSLLGHKDIRTTQIYVHLSNSHLHDEYNRAMSQLLPAPSSTHVIRKNKHKFIPKVKRINWCGYLDSLPDWLTKLIRSYCLKHSQVKDSIQQNRNVLSQLSRFFRWMLEKQAFSCMSEITPRYWFAYTETRLSSGIKPTSLNTTLRSLQSFVKFVGDLGHPICERILDTRPLKIGESFPRNITETQLNQLLQQVNPFDYAWILLMAQSGLRTCEIRDLRWQDVDLQRRTVQINESKGLRSRVTFLSISAQNALKRLPKTPEYVFTSSGQPLSNRYYQSRLKALGKDCGIHVTPHQLRHTCATMLLNAGMSIFGVQAILGHKYVDTTLRYTRVHDLVVAKDYKQAVKAVQQKKSASSLLEE
jgi:site-specific recombinase XerD